MSRVHFIGPTRAYAPPQPVDFRHALYGSWEPDPGQRPDGAEGGFDEQAFANRCVAHGEKAAEQLPALLRAAFEARLVYAVHYLFALRRSAIQVARLDSILDNDRLLCAGLAATDRLMLELRYPKARIEHLDEVPLRRGNRGYSFRQFVRDLRRRLGSKVDILLVSLQGNATRSAIPLGRVLAETGESVGFLILSTDGSSAEQLRKAGLPFQSLERTVRPGDLVHYLRHRRRLSRIIREQFFTPALHEAKLPSFVSFARVIRHAEDRMVSSLGPIVLEAASLRRAIRTAAPQRIVSVTDHPLVARLAADLSVEAPFLYQQGILAQSPQIAQQLRVSGAIVGSRLEVPWMTSSGLPEHAIHLVGYADYAHFASLRGSESQRELRRHLPQSEDRPIVVFGSQYATDSFPEWARRLQISVLEEVATRLPKYHFVLKLHPRREWHDPQTKLENITVVRDSPLVPWIHQAKAFVTYWSTSALEGYLLGKPVAQLNATGLPDYFPISREAGLPCFRDADSLLDWLGKLDDPAFVSAWLEQQRTFLQRKLPYSSEEAAQRGAALLRTRIPASGSAED